MRSDWASRAERCGAQFLAIDADHSPFYSAPEEFVALLLGLANSWAAPRIRYSTISVPRMNGCTWQTNWYVPGGSLSTPCTLETSIQSTRPELNRVVGQ